MIYPLVMTKIATENDHRKFVDFPMKHCDFPVSYVKLPEGKITSFLNLSCNLLQLRLPVSRLCLCDLLITWFFLGK